MTQDDWLTDELMQRARKLIEDIDGTVSQGTVYTVSRALLAAEKRGEERERERACRIMRGVAEVLGNHLADLATPELLNTLADAINADIDAARSGS